MRPGAMRKQGFKEKKFSLKFLIQIFSLPSTQRPLSVFVWKCFYDLKLVNEKYLRYCLILDLLVPP